MSKIKHSKGSFTNEDTVRRRAWIEKALAGVRGNAASGEGDGSNQPKKPRPHLYVVNPDKPS